MQIILKKFFAAFYEGLLMSISSFLRDPMGVKRPVYHTYSETFTQRTPTGSLKSVVWSFGFPIIFLLGFSSLLVTKLNLNGTIHYADLTSITFIFLLKIHLSIFQSNTQVYLIKAIILISDIVLHQCIPPVQWVS